MCSLANDGGQQGVTLIYSRRFLHTFSVLQQLGDTFTLLSWEHVNLLQNIYRQSGVLLEQSLLSPSLSLNECKGEHNIGSHVLILLVTKWKVK